MQETAKRLVIVSGLSGAGKTVALHALEDSGFYCIDNLPIVFLSEFARQVREDYLPAYRQVAVGIDARNPAEGLSQFPEILSKLQISGRAPELLFIEATDDVLIQRFSETRRKHPLSSATIGLPDAIARERKLLGPLSECADLRVDTSHTHELRDLIRDRVVGRRFASLALQFISFGFKYGIPRDADFVFDVRVLPNPHWQANLRDFSGRDAAVVEYLESAPMVAEMVQELHRFLWAWVPRFEGANRSYLTVAVGCTGGRHRSVYVVERVAAAFAAQSTQVIVKHRDM
jgi:RNase adapter protein RapZ